METSPKCQQWKCTSRGICSEIGACHDWILDVVMLRYGDGTADLPGEDHQTRLESPASTANGQMSLAERRHELPNRPAHLYR